MSNFISQFTGLQIEERLTKAGTAIQPEGLTKTAVGLGNVDNTSDADKPISTATQQALDNKQDSLVSGTNIKTINGESVLGGGNMVIVGGLQYLTEVRNTTAPNATVPVHGVQASGAETNIDLLLQQKGTGAIVAQVPDGTTAGGNKRGANAVDLQTLRTANTQVASGQYSVIVGGSGNSATSIGAVVLGGKSNAANNNFAFVGGGQSNYASGIVATIAGGNSNSTSGPYSSIGGGSANSASGNYSAIAGGNANNASGNYSTIPGGQYATTNSIQGLLAYGFNAGATGQTQMAFWGGRQSTTASTATRLTADAASAGSTNQLAVRNNSAFRVKGTVVARDTTSNDAKEWTFEALIKRGANAASTSIVGTPTVASTFADTAAAGWSIDVTADTTNGALAVTAIGEAGKTIRWTCVVHSIEVA